MVRKDYGFQTLYEQSIFADRLRKLAAERQRLRPVKNVNDALGYFIQSLPSLEGRLRNGGNLFFIRQMMPHSPYVDENCIPQNLLNANPNSPKNFPLYSSSSECVFKRLHELSNALKKYNDLNTFIILGDHGSGYGWSVDEMRRRMSAFAAISSPYDCAFGKSISFENNLSFLHEALRCAGFQFSGLNDISHASFWGEYENHPKFGTVRLFNSSEMT